jgi:Ala-tRNA(Pro) deacylase
VDLERVAQLLNADSAWLASEGDLARLFPDCEVGAPVPFGRPYGIPTVMDASLRDDEYVVFPAGTHTESVRMLRRDYERIAEPMVATIVRRPLAATRQSAALSV